MVYRQDRRPGVDRAFLALHRPQHISRNLYGGPHLCPGNGVRYRQHHVASVILGIAVDDTAHFLHKLKTSCWKENLKSAMLEVYEEIGGSFFFRHRHPAVWLSRLLLFQIHPHEKLWSIVFLRHRYRFGWRSAGVAGIVVYFYRKSS